MNSQEYYNSFKEKYPEVVLLVRTDDVYQAFNDDVANVYQAFNDDAAAVHAVLGSDVSKEVANAKAARLLYTTCIPERMLDVILPKLVKVGRRVVICDSQEVPGIKRNKAVQISINS